LNKRKCPVCDSNDADIIMRFTPELLSAVNQIYTLWELKNAVKGKENLLTYSKCKRCKMIYCQNIWDDLTLRQVYQNSIDHAKSKDKILSLQKRLELTRFWNNILRILILSGKKRFNGLKVIDYGCGWGDFSELAQGFGVDVLGYDEDTIKIEFFKKRGLKVATNIDELKSFGPVDVFAMISVLEHLQDVEYTLNLAKELLRPNGLLVFFVMDFRSKYINKNVKKLKNSLPALTKILNPVEHVNIYDYKSVRSTLKRYNFDFISTGLALNLTEPFLIRNSMFILNTLNKIEWLSARIITGKGLGISVYALNQK